MTYRNREYDLHQRQRVTIVSLRKVKELNSINPSDSNGCANRCKGRRMVRLPDELHPALVLLAPALRIEGIKLDLCDIIVDGGLQAVPSLVLPSHSKKIAPSHYCHRFMFPDGISRRPRQGLSIYLFSVLFLPNRLFSREGGGFRMPDHDSRFLQVFDWLLPSDHRCLHDL